jgi:hypothetical protein
MHVLAWLCFKFVSSRPLTQHCPVCLLSLLPVWTVQVKKVEGYGSSSGKTSKKIVIADCGQIS